MTWPDLTWPDLPWPDNASRIEPNFFSGDVLKKLVKGENVVLGSRNSAVISCYLRAMFENVIRLVFEYLMGTIVCKSFNVCIKTWVEYTLFRLVHAHFIHLNKHTSAGFSPSWRSRSPSYREGTAPVLDRIFTFLTWYGEKCSVFLSFHSNL